MTSWRSRGLKAPLSGEFPVSLLLPCGLCSWGGLGCPRCPSQPLPAPPPPGLVLNPGVFASHHNEKSLHDFEAELHFFF